MNNDRASRAWQANKNKGTTRVRPSLDRVQRIEFLELVAQMSSIATFERKLGLTSADVAFYKRELDVESPDEARRKARKLQLQSDDEREARIVEQTRQVREAERIAQARLEVLEAQKAARELEKPARKTDINSVRHEDAERQRRLDEQLSAVKKPAKEWHLPMEAGSGSKEEQMDRFRRDIVYHGLGFTAKKHNVTPAQIRYEASRLKLSINWDIVRK